MSATPILWLILLAGSAAVAASAPMAFAPAPLDERLAQARAEAAAADEARQRAEAAAANANDEAARLRLQQVAALQAVAAEEARITSAETTLRLVGDQIAAQRATLARESAPLSSLLAGLATMGRQPALAVLADGNSPQELVKMKLLVSSVAPAIQRKTESLATRLEQSGRLRQAALDARQQALASRKALERRKFELAELESRALQLAATGNAQAVSAADLATARTEEAALLAREGASERSARAVARELAAIGPAQLPQRSTESRPPLRYMLPAAAPVTVGFGSLSDSGVRSRGVTLGTRRGARVRAPASGTILYSGPFGDYDGVLIIDHGSGWRSVLVNVGARASRGARVRIGEPLGTALGPIEVQLQQGGEPVSPAIIAGSYALLLNKPKSG